jgi:spermidine/putrescine-binding protein
MIEKLISEGMLAEIDYANVPNMSLIDEKFLEHHTVDDLLAAEVMRIR